MVLLASTWSSLELMLMVVLASMRSSQRTAAFQEIWPVTFLFPLAGVVCGFVAGIKTLIVLNEPDIRRAFR